jgi:uncharacterized protein YecE (DUF72 family)
VDYPSQELRREYAQSFNEGKLILQEKQTNSTAGGIIMNTTRKARKQAGENGDGDEKEKAIVDLDRASDSEKVAIGTSGWSYKEWEGVFYPDSKTSKLKYYSSVFKTAEIDSTFYASPSKGLVFGWVRNAPENFVYSVKLPKTITHEKLLDLSQGAELELVKFLDLLSPMKRARKLGPLLIQLPPSFSLSKKEKLEEFFVEFRNKSWLKDPDLHALLRKYNVANTIVDEPLLPIDLTTTSDDFAFVRWHGRGEKPWYNYLYKEEELDPWVERIDKLASKVKRVYGYFNNHFHGNAVENSLEFMEKLGIATAKQEKVLGEIKTKRSEGREQKSLVQF